MWLEIGDKTPNYTISVKRDEGFQQHTSELHVIQSRTVYGAQEGSRRNLGAITASRKCSSIGLICWRYCSLWPATKIQLNECWKCENKPCASDSCVMITPLVFIYNTWPSIIRQGLWRRGLYLYRITENVPIKYSICSLKSFWLIVGRLGYFGT